MTDAQYKVLICDDDDAFAEMLQEYLGLVCHCDVARVSSEDELWQKIGLLNFQLSTHLQGPSFENREDPYDVLFLDYHLPGTNGLEILKNITRENINLPTVMMTGQGSEQIAARAIQSGALDYLVKGQYSFSVLDGLVERAVQVSRLKRSMQESLKQIQYQAMVLNGVRDAVVVWGINGEITYWNRSAEQLFGLRSTQMIGQSVYEVYFSLFQPPYQFPLKFDEGIYQSERWFRLNDQERVWVSSQISTLYDSGNPGLTIGFMDVTRDITSQKRIEEKLQLRLQTEHLLSQLSSQLINITDDQGEDYLSDALRKVAWQINAHIGLVFTRSEMRLENLVLYQESKLEKLPAKGQDPADRTVLPVDLSKDCHPWRISDLQKWSVISLPSVKDLPSDADLRDFLLHRNVNTAILIPMIYSGNVFGVILFGLKEWGSQWEGDYDYLLRTFGQIMLKALLQQQSEHELRYSEDRYRAIVEKYQTEMICRFSPDFQLTFANETYCHYYQIDRNHMAGTSFLHHILDADQEKVRDVVADLTAEKPVSSVTFRINGSQVKWQEWSIRGIIADDGNLMECQAVGRDITERIEMEEKVQTAQARLAQANRLASIGQLASSVAHQLSNPLTTIIGDAQLLLHGLNADDPDRESAQAIVDAGWRAQQVIHEMLKFSQSSEGVREDVSVAETVQEALLLSSPHIFDAGVELVIDLPDADLVIEGKEQQIVDLWVNLFLAIVSQSESRGVKKIRIQAKSEQDKVIIECAHDGIPVSEKDLQTILEPQLIPTSAKWGTGMELSVCREIVRQQDGEIIVYPKNHETVYQITFQKGGNL